MTQDDQPVLYESEEQLSAELRGTQLLHALATRLVSARLDLSVKTIEAHKANAMQKLDMTGRIDIVRYAVLRGLLQSPEG